MLAGHVGHPPLVAVLPERHDVRRVPGPRDVEGDPGRVRTAYGAQPAVVGQPGRLEQPAGEHVVLDERHRGRGSRGDAEQRGRIGPGASAAPALGRPGEPGEAERLRAGPRGRGRGRRRGWASGACCGMPRRARSARRRGRGRRRAARRGARRASSAHPQPAGDDPAQDLVGAAAQGEAGPLQDRRRAGGCRAPRPAPIRWR